MGARWKSGENDDVVLAVDAAPNSPAQYAIKIASSPLQRQLLDGPYGGEK